VRWLHLGFENVASQKYQPDVIPVSFSARINNFNGIGMSSLWAAANAEGMKPFDDTGRDADHG